MSTSTPWWKWKEKEVREVLRCDTSSIENGCVQNPKINWKEKSRVRIDRIAFTAEASFENLSKEQNTEFICPQRRKEFWQTQSKPS